MSVPRPAIFGRDRDHLLRPPGLRDDLRLVGVLLGVQHLVVRFAFCSIAASFSEFSIEVVAHQYLAAPLS